MTRIHLLILCAAGLPAFAWSAECRTVPAPGGGMTTECPSEAPPAPPASVQSTVPDIPVAPEDHEFGAMCNLPDGRTCTVLFNRPPRPGTRCYCDDGPTRLYGTTGSLVR